MSEFNDEIRKQIIDRFATDFPVLQPGHKAVDAILKEALAHPGLQAKANADYTRTYTRGDYNMYDRTHSGKGIADFPVEFNKEKINQILQKISGEE